MLKNKRPTASVTGKCGIWLEKPKGENAKGTESLQVWAHRPESLTGTPALVQCTSERREAAVLAGGLVGQPRAYQTAGYYNSYEPNGRRTNDSSIYDFLRPTS